MPCSTSTTGRAGVSGGKKTAVSDAATLVVASVTARTSTKRIRSIPSVIGKRSFVARLTREQREHRIVRRDTLVEHAMHGVDDRHVDAIMQCELARGARRGHALGDMADLGQYRGERLSARQSKAHTPVARQIAGAREHEITKPREPHQRLRAPAERGRKT